MSEKEKGAELVSVMVPKELLVEAKDLEKELRGYIPVDQETVTYALVENIKKYRKEIECKTKVDEYLRNKED